VNGTVLYSETQQTTTNSYGLFTLAIGKGTPVTGTFAGINWASGTDKFLKVEIAPAGGVSYQLQGTTQLLSVPYALYAEKTRLLAGNNTINITNGNTITGNYQAGNNTVLVNGNLITGNYQAANNTVLVNGNTIAGNYLAANNTVLVNGNTIAGNYLAANNTVLVNGNTIAGNYQAGSGINITGNTISATGGGSSLWIADANGIHNISGKVGIGVNSHSIYPLDVYQPNSGVGNAVARFQSDDVWHAAISIKNNPANYQYAFIVGGPTNIELRPNNFCIMNTNLSTISKLSITVDGATNNIGMGFTNTIYPAGGARSTLHIFRGDINIEQIGSGIIIKSPDGQCWRITIDNAGNLIRTAIVCP
jgi:hypothetical protein